MGKIISVSPSVSEALKQLVWTLYNEGYFGFEQDAHKYAEKLKKAIYNDLPNLTHYETPLEIKKYGRYYVKLKGNKRHVVRLF